MYFGKVGFTIVSTTAATFHRDLRAMLMAHRAVLRRVSLRGTPGLLMNPLYLPRWSINCVMFVVRDRLIYAAIDRVCE